jgi:hypothetical protein
MDAEFELQVDTNIELNAELGAEIEIDAELGAEIEIDAELGAEIEIDADLGAEIEIDADLGAEIEIDAERQIFHAGLAGAVKNVNDPLLSGMAKGGYCCSVCGAISWCIIFGLSFWLWLVIGFWLIAG